MSRGGALGLRLDHEGAMFIGAFMGEFLAKFALRRWDWAVEVGPCIGACRGQSSGPSFSLLSLLPGCPGLSRAHSLGGCERLHAGRETQAEGPGGPGEVHSPLNL